MIFFLFFTIGWSGVSAQGIQGKIVDINGNPVPYASIFIKQLTRGTTSNALGLFSLPLPAGEYTIFFRSLGYSEVIKRITLEESVMEMEIILPPQTYMIPEVVISASGEDPAYRVMRKAIGLANYHLNQVSTYEAEIYIKGTAYFRDLPRAIAKRIQVGDVKIKENQAYMLESLNEVTYRAPDKYDMRILASQNTIPGYAQSVNPMDYINASLYQPEIESFVSPLARNAFFYYEFSFEGSFLQGTYMIDKIKVTPKRKSQQLCEGYIYIVEDLWCLHSSDLVVNTIAGDLNLEQQYANVIMDAWLPVSHKLEINIKLAGVDADVTYVSSLEYKKTVLNANLPRSYFEPQTSKVSENKEEDIPTPTKEQEKIQEILEKDDLNNRDMARLTKLMEKEAERADTSNNKLEVVGTSFSIARDAVKNDSAFWNEIRPVPLTVEEVTTLTERDSTLGIGNPDRDTTIKTLNGLPRRQSINTKDILFGKLFVSKKRKTRIRYGGLIDFDQLGFNTVDGWRYGQYLNFDYRPTTKVAYRWYLNAAYDFARKAPDIKWESNILYAAPVRAKISLDANYRSTDFNETDGIPDLTNAFYSLFLKDNYSKRFEIRSVKLENRMDIATGFVFYATINYKNRLQLENNTNFSFVGKSKDYSPNFPQTTDENNTLIWDTNNAIFQDSKSISARIRFEYTYEYYYHLRSGRKIYFKSDYPTLFVDYEQAFPVVDETGWADYQVISFGLQHKRDVGLLSELEYKAEAGFFPGKEAMHFSDYKHFKTAPLLVDMAGMENTFYLLDYYRASTNSSYAEGHVRINSPYLALKLIPWLSERLWTESLALDYLYTSNVNHYTQLGYSINEIAFMLDLGIYTAFENWRYYGTGFRINFRF